MKHFKKPILICILLMITSITVTYAQEAKMNYYYPGEGLRFTGKNGYELAINGYAQPMLEYRVQTDTFSNMITQERYRMRRLRIRIAGDSPQNKVSYRLQFDLSGSSETGDASSNYLLDAYIKYNFTRRISLTFGQRSTYTDNRELFMGSHTLQLVERSRLTSVFSSIREFGLFLQADHRTKSGRYIKSYLTLTNGDGLNVFNPDHGGLKAGGRLDFLPFGLFTYFGQFRQADIMRENSIKLVIGASASYNVGISSRRGRESGTIIYLNEDLRESLPDYAKIGVDFLLKYKGFSALGEWVKSYASVPDEITIRVRNDGSRSTSFLIDGEQNVSNYIKNRMMLGSGINIQMGYVFKNLYSIDARYTRLFADPYSFMNNGTFYNRPAYYTLGLSKYMGRHYGLKMQASVSCIELAPGSNDGNNIPIEGYEWIGRFITSIAF